MKLFPAFALFLAGSSLWPQEPRELIFAARRAPTVEVLDPVNFQTVARIQFPFRVDRVITNIGRSTVGVDGYDGNRCCQPYNFDFATGKLSKVSTHESDSFGGCLFSPDGRWCARLKSFRGPALKVVDTQDGTVRELIPSGLPPGNNEGNWYATGTWLGNRFVFYVGHPGAGGFLWVVPPDAERLGPGREVSEFGEAAGCEKRLPVNIALVVASGQIFLYEPFGNKVDRSASCTEPPPGGAWQVDTIAGRILRPIAPQLRFNTLVPNRSGSTLYGVVRGNGANWQGATELVALSVGSGEIQQSRTFNTGVLLVAVGSVTVGFSGDLFVQTPQ